MSKNTVLIVIILLVILIGISYFNKISNQIAQTNDYSNQMSGNIVEVKNGLIVVSGTVKSSNPNSSFFEKRSVEFAITPQTVLKKILYTMPEDVKSREPFFPTEKQSSGDSSDLVAGITIFRIKSKEDLFKVDRTTAEEIDYAIFEFIKLEK